MRSLRWLLIVAVVLQGFAPALAYARVTAAPAGAPPVVAAPTSPTAAPAVPLLPQDDPAPVYTPADLPDGIAVTINVEPAEIPAGGTITVSGQGAPGGAQVRLAAVNEGKTLGMQDVALAGDGSYSAEIPVDATYPPGPVEICALGLGLENAEVVCTTLVITPPANGSVSGQLPLDGVTAARAAAIDAEFRLMNAAGAVVQAVPIGANGSFSLADVAPGVYQYAVAGRVPKLSDVGTVKVQPIKDSFLELAIRDTCGISELLKPTTALNANPSRVEFTRKSRYNGLFWTYVDERRPFGLYVTGVRNDVTFTASPQATGAVQKVVFEFFGVNGQVIQRLEDASAPYAVVFDVGRLPASRGDIHPFVSVTPVVAGKTPCASLYDIEVMGDPMSSPYLQPVNSRTTWDGGSHTYQFEGVLPYVEDLLPAKYSLGSVPFLGEIKNEFNTGVFVKGYFDLEGKARIFLSEVFADALLLSLPILPPGETRQNITPPGLGQVQFDIRNPAHMAIPYGPLELYQRDLVYVPFAKILVFTYFGIVNAYVAGGLSFGVGLYLEGEVRPLAPSVDSTLTGNGRFGADLGLSIDLLLGLVEGGAGLGGEVCVGLPLRVVLSSEPDVFFDDPVVGGRIYLVIWASAIWGLVKTRTTKTLVPFGPGCPGGAVFTAAEADPPVPDVFRSPAVAAANDGRVLTAYVENTAPPGATPQVQIMARFQDADTGAWSDPQALSDPLHSAQSPTVAFVGPNLTPMVAWSENMLTAAEAADLGDEDPAAHMRRQEIFYTLFNGDAGWGAPIRLTSDELPDGLPEAAGSPTISILAWTTDIDGDANTRGDQHIAIAAFDAGTQLFSAPTLKGYTDGDHPDGVLNNDVAVAVDTQTANAYVAWVYDLDADLTTGDDRHLAVVYGNGGNWEFLSTAGLPGRVDSPALTVTPDGVQVAFLVREPTPDGEVGLLGTNGVLWTALYNHDNEWAASPVQDAAGKPVYAEQPALEHDAQEALLVFRRFDEATRRGGLGQISMSRLYQINPPTPPLYLTDAPDQQWMSAVAINPINSRAIVVHSALGVGAASAAALAEPLAATQALPATQQGVLQTSANPVLFLTLENEADPALDPLQASIQAPAPGATVNLTVTVRNVGRGTATDMRLDLYRGPVEDGAFVDEQVVPGELAFNATATVAFAVVAPNDLAPTGQLSLTVQLVTGGDNVSTGNDAATIALGGLSAPSRVAFLGENVEYTGTLDLAWSGNAGEYVTGYRVYRGAAANGPWALVGESAVPSFTDSAVVFDQSYCYAVQAYNAQGALSPRGAAACDMLHSTPVDDSANLFIPTIRKP